LKLSIFFPEGERNLAQIRSFLSLSI